RQIEHFEPGDRRSLAISGGGFVLLLAASCGIEALRLYTLKAALPLAPGGVIGALVGEGMHAAFGFTGATLVLLVLIAIGLSLFAQVSLIAAIERLGGWLEQGFMGALAQITAWRDRKAGAVAAVAREASVAKVRKRLEVHAPVRIEPPLAAIPKSERVTREKQRSLFEEIP